MLLYDQNRVVRWHTVIATLCALLLGVGCGDDEFVDHSVPTSSQEAQLLVSLHNQTRAAATPVPAPALEEVSWERDLARVAQNYAEQCVWTHNSNRSNAYASYGGEGYVGENLSAITGGSASTPPLEGMYSGWANEAGNYDYGTNSCQAGAMCGHYTQIVWRESVRIGCGWARCPQVEGLDGWSDVWLLVCNYAPGGNYQGSKPY